MNEQEKEKYLNDYIIFCENYLGEIISLVHNNLTRDPKNADRELYIVCGRYPYKKLFYETLTKLIKKIRE